MKTSQAGIDLIKKFEGCRLTAYKPVAAEKYWTIGWGHYGPDITQGMTITQARADELLVQDLEKYEDYVTATGLTLTQNQFDALVSFTYNCGAGNLAKLVKGRDYQQIADAMLLYNKGSGQVLEDLARRRRAERELFLSDTSDKKTGNPYSVPTKTLKCGSRGDGVRWLQYELNDRKYGLIVDGDFGEKTEEAVRSYQMKRGLTVDGIVGARTRAELAAGK